VKKEKKIESLAVKHKTAGN